MPGRAPALFSCGSVYLFEPIVQPQSFVVFSDVVPHVHRVEFFRVEMVKIRLLFMSEHRSVVECDFFYVVVSNDTFYAELKYFAEQSVIGGDELSQQWDSEGGCSVIEQRQGQGNQLISEWKHLVLRAWMEAHKSRSIGFMTNGHLFKTTDDVEFKSRFTVESTGLIVICHRRYVCFQFVPAFG